jgi:hypothetical protein
MLTLQNGMRSHVNNNYNNITTLNIRLIVCKRHTMLCHLSCPCDRVGN